MRQHILRRENTAVYFASFAHLEPDIRVLINTGQEAMREGEQLDVLLEPTELRRARGIRNPASLRRFVYGRCLLRWALELDFGMAQSDIRLGTTDQGRPVLLSNAGIRFSLSHTQSLVAVIISEAFEVGVDIENVDRKTRTEAIAQRFLTQRELSCIRSHPIAKQKAAFFQIWTLKEAYLKALGLGLSSPLDGFSFLLRSGDVLEFLPEIPQPRLGSASMRFDLFDVENTHRLAALCIDRDSKLRPGIITSPVLVEVDLSEVIASGKRPRAARVPHSPKMSGFWEPTVSGN